MRPNLTKGWDSVFRNRKMNWLGMIDLTKFGLLPMATSANGTIKPVLQKVIAYKFFCQSHMRQ